MIHINRGDGPHEWLTTEEFRRRYPNAAPFASPRPYRAEGERLKKMRQEKNWSLRECAKQFGIGLAELSAIECGKVQANYDVVALYSGLEVYK